MVSTVRYRTFKDVHLSTKSLAVFLFLCVAGLAVGVATRASFVIPVYVAAYVAMGLAETLLGRRPAPAVAAATLPPAVRAQLEEDEALEAEEEDLETKPRGDEYV
jgi:CDP-diacylglycerol--serine O-phosphatidyltransferase